ncbi:PH domain-containing protein [Nonomuraea sp. NN258]|uniref:PH domain-containing protein n=1 Tax=Nonomuraea antri TaxID=2730852 RepID=UPI00156A4E64|nr:PH domain-containing protein [Nonomuraea antri]NRQ38901.1 PH domain-containing protein [Nonomuraea antri]
MRADAETHGEVGWQELPRRSLAASAVKSLAIVVPVVGGLVRFLMSQDWSPGGMVAAGAGAAALVVAGVLLYDAARLRATRWRLTAERLELRTGVAVRQHRSIPRDRVRSVDLRADPVSRVFGLTLVKVGTGEHAGDGTELTLDPLPRRQAEALRRRLLAGDAAPAHRDEPRPEAALAELRWSWIRLAPLSVWTFTGAAAVLGLAYKGLDVLGAEVFAKETALGVWGWVTANPWLAVPLILIANAAVGMLGAGLLFAESWGRYRLEREPGRLRLRRGLLTSRSLTLEVRRLRGVEISRPLLLRLGGGARVKAVATGLGKAAEGETEDVAALTPPVPLAVAEQVAAAVAALAPSRHPVVEGVPGMGGAPLRAHPPAARRRRIVRALGWVAALAVAAAVTALLVPWLSGWAWLVPAATLPVACWLAVAGYRGLGHALGRRHLVTGTGATVRRTVALERAGIVGWTISQSYFQRRSGLLTVTATTAAGSGHYSVLDVGHDDGLDLAARAVPGLLEPFLVRGEQRAA